MFEFSGEKYLHNKTTSLNREQHVFELAVHVLFMCSTVFRVLTELVHSILEELRVIKALYWT